MPGSVQKLPSLLRFVSRNMGVSVKEDPFQNKAGVVPSCCIRTLTLLTPDSASNAVPVISIVSGAVIKFPLSGVVAWADGSVVSAELTRKSVSGFSKA